MKEEIKEEEIKGENDRLKKTYSGVTSTLIKEIKLKITPLYYSKNNLTRKYNKEEGGEDNIYYRIKKNETLNVIKTKDIKTEKALKKYIKREKKEMGFYFKDKDKETQKEKTHIQYTILPERQQEKTNNKNIPIRIHKAVKKELEKQETYHYNDFHKNLKVKKRYLIIPETNTIITKKKKEQQPTTTTNRQQHDNKKKGWRKHENSMKEKISAAHDMTIDDEHYIDRMNETRHPHLKITKELFESLYSIIDHLIHINQHTDISLFLIQKFAEKTTQQRIPLFIIDDMLAYYKQKNQKNISNIHRNINRQMLLSANVTNLEYYKRIYKEVLDILENHEALEETQKETLHPHIDAILDTNTALIPPKTFIASNLPYILPPLQFIKKK